MSEPLIHARGLTKTYGDFVAVDGIDFDVARGESFGFLGPNGAGKSTTMRIIGATSVRTSGTLTILGKDPEVNGPQIRALDRKRRLLYGDDLYWLVLHNEATKRLVYEVKAL